MSITYCRSDKEIRITLHKERTAERYWEIPLREFIRDSGIPAEHWREALEAEGILKGGKE